MSGLIDRPRRTRLVRGELDVAGCWSAFRAAEQVGDHADHSASFRARILVTDEKGKQTAYDGATGSVGHAEMAALDAMLSGLGSGPAKTALGKSQVSVDAVGKPCCVHCSTMLGLLGVQPYSTATTKTRKTMLAGGAWGLSMNLRAFVVEGWNISERSLDGFSGAGQASFDQVL